MISHNRLLRDTFVPSSELSTVPRIYDLSPFFFDIFEKASRGDRSITIHDIYYIYIYASLREREREKKISTCLEALSRRNTEANIRLTFV